MSSNRKVGVFAERTRSGRWSLRGYTLWHSNTWEQFLGEYEVEAPTRAGRIREAFRLARLDLEAGKLPRSSARSVAVRGRAAP